VSGQRDNEHIRKLYRTARWERLRKAQFSVQPLCELCLQREDIVIAKVVHHSQGGHRNDVERFWSGPFQSLCMECHSRHGAAEDRGEEVVTIGVDGYPI